MPKRRGIIGEGERSSVPLKGEAKATGDSSGTDEACCLEVGLGGRHTGEHTARSGREPHTHSPQ